MIRRNLTIAAAAAALITTGSFSAIAANMTGASCFPKGTYFSKTFEQFVPELNGSGAGVTVKYVGGAPAIGSPFTLVQKASKGVYGMVSCTGAYYQNVLPEADAIKLIEVTNEELRQNGGMAYLEKLENGTVVGYGWPITGILPDWHKVTKYRVDPGFYSADINIMMSMSAWNKLSAAQKKAVTDLAVKYEGLAKAFGSASTAAAAKQASQGIEAITFSGADREKWLTTAREAGWANVLERSPEHGAALKKLFTKQ